MAKKHGIHFEVSERKILLRILDLVMVYLGVYCLSLYFDFEYIVVSTENSVALILLGVYVSIFATIFELYDLQKASRLDTTFKNIVITASTVVLFYLLTPVLSPFLPIERMQIVYLYLTIVVSILLWRLVYINLIESPRFYKRVLLVGEVSNIESIVNALDASDPNYKIVGFVNCEVDKMAAVKFNAIKEYSPNDIREVIKKENLSEIVVASYSSENITSEIYYTLIKLLEEGFPINEYTQGYEDLTYSSPVCWKRFLQILPI